RIAQKQPPERHVTAIHRTLAGPAVANEFLQCAKAFLHTFEVDPFLFGLLLAELAEARDAPRIAGGAAVPRAQSVSQRALALRAPHDAVDIVRARVVLDQPQQEIAVIRIVKAQIGDVSAVEVALLKLLNIGNVAPENVLQPANGFHTALLRGWQ